MVERSPSRVPLTLLVFGLVSALGVALTMALRPIAVRPERGKTADDVGDQQLASTLRLNRIALAATEELDTATASENWNRLHEADPTDTAVAMNRALNELLRVDALTAIVRDTSSDPDEVNETRQVLPARLAAARDAIEDVRATEHDASIVDWMAMRVDLREATLLPRSMTKAIRRDVFHRLVELLIGSQEPLVENASHRSASRGQRVLLAGLLIEVLDQLEDPIEGIPTAFRQPGTDALVTLSEELPANLYLATRAAQLAILAKDRRAAELIRRTGALASAIGPTLSRQLDPIGQTPTGMVDAILNAIEDGNWQGAESNSPIWFNLLTATELIKTDRRRVTPHPLDLLRFDAIQRIAAERARENPLAAGPREVSFAAIELPCESTAELIDTVTIDANLDLRPDVLTLRQLEAGAELELILNDGGEHWNSVATQGLPGTWTEMIVTDLFMVDSSSPGRLRRDSTAARHNTLQCVVVYGDSGIRIVVVDARDESSAGARLTLWDQKSGLEATGPVTAMTTGDLEGDGDLDLVIATRESIQPWINRGNRTFFLAAAENSVVPINRPVIAMEIADVDRDLDLDILSLHAGESDGAAQVGWFENLLHLQFRHQILDAIPAVAHASSLSITDYDGNASWDVVVSSGGALQATPTSTPATGVWKLGSSWTHPLSPDGSSLNGRSLVCDLDNDGRMEVMQGRFLCQLPDLSQAKASMQTVVVKGMTDRFATQRVADFDQDGNLDVLAVTSDGSATKVWTLINETSDLGESVTVRFKGIDDNNVNSGRVNHYAVGSVLELWVGPHYRSRVIRDPVTHFGIDGSTEDASMRIIFPNGLTQALPTVTPGMLIEEEQTLKGSCPYLYAWNGEEFAFVTDCLWAAPLGLQVAPGIVVPDRPWEHLLIDGSSLQPKAGVYELRITEELWEVAYFDHLSLTRVRHPDDIRVFTNEKVGPASIAEPKLHAFKSESLKPACRATDMDGNDVSDLLREIDRRHVRGFQHRIRQGLCPPHAIDLVLADHFSDSTPDEARVHLVLTGWILPTDTSLNIQIDQNPNLPAPQAPSLWVPSETQPEQWVEADPYIGFPGGKNKTIVVDITDHVRRSDPRIRVQTSAQIYWDAAWVSVRTPFEIKASRDELAVETLPMISAEVAWHGFSKRLTKDASSAEVTQYNQAEDAPRWPPLLGELSRQGDVTQLLDAWDDSMVVIAGGDEIRVRFEARQKAVSIPRHAGTARSETFVLHGVGWDKDADLNTLTGQSVDPLPSREMAAYPPRFDQRASVEKQQRQNSHHRRRSQPFRSFWSWYMEPYGNREDGLESGG
ncbi:MAG: VCBS repeat-containing protein [Planctomycetota bacterium]